MSGLTTHILDTAHGYPAADVQIDLFSLIEDQDGGRLLIKSTQTNDDGRTSQPLLSENDISPGLYELEFHIGDYFKRQGVELIDPVFLNVVPVRFGIADVAQHYHVPLLVSPYGYSTYRGS